MNNNLLNSEQCIEFLKLQIDNEKTNDPGCELDIIIVNNNTNNHEANLYIDTLNGQKIFNGIIRVFHRQNIGGSFGAFSYAYDQIFNEYDYFLFNEDDIMLTEPDYFKKAIEILQSDDSVGFVAFSPISYHEPYHCGGGFGVTSKRILELVKQRFGILPYHAENTYSAFEQSEIIFTNCIHTLGFKIVNVPEYSPLASNYEKHTSQNKPEYVTNENLNKTFIYKVGF
jgi:GT2 family glycosyltransferase